MRAAVTTGCLMPSCNEPKHYARGLCRTHYLIAYNLVRRQQITWAELVAAGKCHHSNGQGGLLTVTSAAVDWLLQAQDGAPK